MLNSLIRLRSCKIRCQSIQTFGTKHANEQQLIRLRADQKKLYGGIISSDAKSNDENIESNQQQIEQNHSSRDSPDAPQVSNPELSGEFHWLIERHQKSKNVKVFGGTSQRSRTLPKSKTEAPKAKPTKTQPATDNLDKREDKVIQKLSPASKKSVILSAKSLLNQFIISRKSDAPHIQRTRSIPFDTEGLRSILNCPLKSKKASLNQIEDTLADQTQHLPSISKVLQATMPEPARQALKRWKLEKIAELGEAGFYRYQQETFRIGKDFHTAIENFLERKEQPEKDSSIIQLWHSVNGVLVELDPKPVLTEKPLMHPTLRYKGIIDSLSMVDNQLCALEWKTSEKSKPTLQSTYDAPVQLCAYLGALNIDSRYDVSATNGYVVVAYKNGDLAHTFCLSDSDVRKYWLMWLHRLQEYWIRYRDNTIPEPV